MTKIRVAAALAAMVAAVPGFAANIVLNNVDAAGVGFNDTTPATPVGGNTGTTIGEQRLIAYEKALELWGKTLKSDVTIVVQGSFARLNCTPSGGTLAQAGALQIFADFPNAPLAGHWYGSALANAIAGFDLTPGPLDPGPLAPPYNDDIVANFNGDVGQDDCIAGPGWYYGLDSNPGPGQIDFLDTFMHEVAHGLGFQNFVNEATGLRPGDDANGIGGLPDVYMANTFDLYYGEPWDTTYYDQFGLTSTFLRVSATNNGNVVWTGDSVTTNAAQVLGPYQGIRVTGTLNKELVFGTASFGEPATADNFGGAIVIGEDGAGASSTDACEPLVNSAAVAGNVALVDRGECAFVIKAANAQAAGATGVIIANNQATGAIGLGGSDPAVTVPTISVSLDDGDAIKAASPGVSVEFFSDPTRLAGTNQNFVRLYAPVTVALGSSISHFDTVASPDLLMEPFITPDLRANENLDLTPSLMKDVGWELETLKIGSCDTGVTSALPTGELLHAKVDQCAAGAKNHGQFVSCVNSVTNAAKSAGYISGSDKAAITSCAAKN
jgi:PA domain